MKLKKILIHFVLIFLIFLLIILFLELNVRVCNKYNVTTMKIYIPSFSNGSRIPVKHTCEGADINPEIVIENVPPEAKSLAIVVYDPDAPMGTFYHWLLYNIPVNGSSKIVIPEGIPKTFKTDYGIQGVNDFGRIGYNGPCPPKGHGTHRYYFLVVALDEKLPEKRLLARNFLDAVRDHVIAEASYVGTYSRD
jgi:Raf kinase inhibitor-like YbhB/YbcL family protein